MPAISGNACNSAVDPTCVIATCEIHSRPQSHVDRASIDSNCMIATPALVVIRRIACVVTYSISHDLTFCRAFFAHFSTFFAIFGGNHTCVDAHKCIQDDTCYSDMMV